MPPREPFAPPAWFAEAACHGKGPDLFFAAPMWSSEGPRPSNGRRKADPYREARQLCACCPAREDCLDYALTTDQRHGCWGGLSPNERRRLQRAADLDRLAF